MDAGGSDTHSLVMDDGRGPPWNRDAIERELERLHADSYRWALACTGRRTQEAHDVLQSAYLKVLDGRAVFRARSSFRTWLFGVIRVTAAEERRREWLRRLRLVADADGQGVADLAANAGDLLVRSEGAELVVAALARLSRRQKEVLELVFYHDLTIEESADVMAVSVGSARRHYDRAKRRMRRLLEGDR